MGIRIRISIELDLVWVRVSKGLSARVRVSMEL